MPDDVCEIIAGTPIEGIGLSAAMRILQSLDEAGFIVVRKPNYAITIEHGPGSCSTSSESSNQTVRPVLSIVRTE